MLKLLEIFTVPYLTTRASSTQLRTMRVTEKDATPILGYLASK